MKKYFEDYMRRAGEILSKTPFDELNGAIELLMSARAEGRWIFAAGNGGSAATASHFVNDFLKGLSVEGKKRFKIMALADCVPVVSAIANDYSYDAGFVEQLKNYGTDGDLLVVYSGSGNSGNVVRAAEYAKSIGMKVLAFTGRDGGRLNAHSDVNCIAPTEVMEEIEDVHMVWEHAMVCGIREKIKAE